MSEMSDIIEILEYDLGVVGDCETARPCQLPQSPLLKGGGGSLSDDGGLSFLPRNKKLKQPSRDLRTGATKQENHLWYDFSRNFVPRFARQRIVDNFILDFFCHEAMLAIELDGEQHYEPETATYDKARTEYLNGLGIEVLRFDNRAVDENFALVCEKIAEAVSRGRKPPPSADDTPFQKGAEEQQVGGMAE